MPTNQNDDDDSGSIGDWLRYKVWSLRGWHIVLAVSALAFIAGYCAA